MQLDYLQRAQFDGNYLGALPPGARLQLTHSAAAWAGGGVDGGQMRFGLLAGARLVLFNNQVMRTVRLDLPFSSGGTGGTGMLVGFSGRRVCLLGSENLTVTDLDSGAVSNIALPEATAEPAAGGGVRASLIPLEAAVDAGLIYVSGPGGIAVYHARTGERLQKTAWPAGLAPAPRPGPVNESVSYLPQGRFRNSNTGRGGLLDPIAAVVSDGVFYTPVSGSRLVALVGEKKEPAP